MKTYFFMLTVILLILILVWSQNVKEGFLADYCGKHTDCTSCAQASGCSWCPKAKACLDSTTLKSTDKTCNQMNTIASDFRCNSVLQDEIPPYSVVSNDIMYDFALYKNKITDKIPPPNLYMAGEMKYSNEDVVSFANNVKDGIQFYQKSLPDIVASSVFNNIQPMVKGILSENYYIQGFEDYRKDFTVQGFEDYRKDFTVQGFEDYQEGGNQNKCQQLNSCSSCVNDQACGWDPNKLSCDTRGPNKSWYITQAPRCVTTSSTLNLMRTQPT